ncbi:MAG: hypothetical protein V3T05_13250 [Myxococcota bacterium]
MVGGFDADTGSRTDDTGPSQECLRDRNQRPTQGAGHRKRRGAEQSAGQCFAAENGDPCGHAGERNGDETAGRVNRTRCAQPAAEQAAECQAAHPQAKEPADLEVERAESALVNVKQQQVETHADRPAGCEHGDGGAVQRIGRSSAHRDAHQ